MGLTLVISPAVGELYVIVLPLTALAVVALLLPGEHYTRLALMLPDPLVDHRISLRGALRMTGDNG